jgi:hypothetical protein
MAHDNERILDANPTKDFFIRMLIKDIELTRAIIDLVDNSVDGALRIRDGKNFVGLTVRIEATPLRFRISDNCGGISVELARKYAFRFGRPDEMPLVNHSVGQFGVGMKRALFKLGSKFIVESKTENSRFVVEEDVNEWKAQKEWQFYFKELEIDVNVPEDQRGTLITVEPLQPNVAEDFGLEFFLSRLRHEISLAHHQTMERGLAITLNGIPIKIHPMELLSSDELKPAFSEKRFDYKGSSVQVKIYAGIANPLPSEAGWYIYCNGRMVMGADQTITTGWGEGSGSTIPKYHNEFARFRGYVFFDSDQTGLLPWNTTKTGVDADSPIFRATRLEMIALMRPVLDFLRRVSTERQIEEDHKPLQDAIDHAISSSVANAQTSYVFLSPKPTWKPPAPRLGRIQYNEPLEKISKAKKALKVTSLKEVGEKTFDYFYKKECED